MGHVWQLVLLQDSECQQIGLISVITSMSQPKCFTSICLWKITSQPYHIFFCTHSCSHIPPIFQPSPCRAVSCACCLNPLLKRTVVSFTDVDVLRWSLSSLRLRAEASGDGLKEPTAYSSWSQFEEMLSHQDWTLCQSQESELQILHIVNIQKRLWWENVDSLW